MKPSLSLSLVDRTLISVFQQDFIASRGRMSEMSDTNGIMILVAIAWALRFLLSCGLFPNIEIGLERQPHVTTPMTSHDALREGSHFARRGEDPYGSDGFHQPPAILLIMKNIPESRLWVAAFLFVVDVLTAYALGEMCAFAARRAKRVKKALSRLSLTSEGLKHKIASKKKWNSSFLSHEGDLRHVVFVLYLLNPFSIAANAALSSESLTHLCVATGLLWSLHGNVLVSAIIWALSTHVDIYMILLVPSILVMMCHRHERTPRRAVISWIVLYGCACYLTLYASARAIGGWTFLTECYVWQFTMKDMTPNVGLFWYTFMQMFDRFWDYYWFVWNVNPVLYVLPLIVHFRRSPLVAFVTTFFVLSVYRVFPTCGSISFAIILLLLLSEDVQRVRYFRSFVFAMCCFASMCSIQWYMWTRTSAGNANYFYFQCLGFLFVAIVLGSKTIEASSLLERCVRCANNQNAPSSRKGSKGDAESRKSQGIASRLPGYSEESKKER